MAADFLVASVEKETKPLFRNSNDLIMVCVHEVIRAASGGRLFVARNGVRGGFKWRENLFSCLLWFREVSIRFYAESSEDLIK